MTAEKGVMIGATSGLMRRGAHNDDDSNDDDALKNNNQPTKVARKDAVGSGGGLPSADTTIKK